MKQVVIRFVKEDTELLMVRMYVSAEMAEALQSKQSIHIQVGIEPDIKVVEDENKG